MAKIETFVCDRCELPVVAGAESSLFLGNPWTISDGKAKKYSLDLCPKCRQAFMDWLNGQVG